MAADEQWVPVTGYEGLYEVSSWGAVRSLDRIIVRRDGQCRRLRGRVLAGGKHSTGYRSVVLSAGDAQKSVLVHRLVADAFCPRKDEACEVNHKNGVKDDNRAVNLEWCTHQENQHHAVNAGLMVASRGERQGASKLTEDKVRRIRHLLAAGALVKDLAAQFDVSTAPISYIKSGKAWRHVA